TVQAPPAVVAPSPPKQAEAPVQSAPPSEAPAPPREPEQVVTTTVAPPARNGN
ncbi:MAG: hypothetical protein QOH20_725, partial [Mycobacterium sp.]|nr:hypothetical protein [Mycobacterium sp.]